MPTKLPFRLSAFVYVFQNYFTIDAMYMIPHASNSFIFFNVSITYVFFFRFFGGGSQILAITYGGQRDATDFHRSGFTEHFLREVHKCTFTFYAMPGYVFSCSIGAGYL